jgi:hypothetical protein
LALNFSNVTVLFNSAATYNANESNLKFGNITCTPKHEHTNTNIKKVPQKRNCVDLWGLFNPFPRYLVLLLFPELHQHLQLDIPHLDIFMGSYLARQ